MIVEISPGLALRLFSARGDWGVACQGLARRGSYGQGETNKDLLCNSAISTVPGPFSHAVVLF